MPNRLELELSPYLLQHKDNPVDWYPWSDEAFDRARDENKPVFLSIGYATCHWCHVMEHESFEDKEVAALMNEVFISIKVDREERPDIDQVYMQYCMMSTGHGGWPLTIVMTPDRRPFFAGTYLPKQSRHGRVGMVDLIPRIQDVWKNRNNEVLESADRNSAILSQAVQWDIDSEIPSKQVITDGYLQLKENFDPVHGGFGSAPKFPSPHQLLFLFRYGHKEKDPYALDIAKHTLKKMYLGGIFDQLGYGFHRYSTDAEWILPHFEKMLYDQAMIVLAAVEAYELTRENVFKEIADRILTYVLRDMSSKEGGFYSAEDADSEGEEGKFYVWTHAELVDHLGQKEATVFNKLYNVTEEGNFIEEATGIRTGQNILYLNEPLGTLDGPQQAALERNRQHLFSIRKQRIHPLKDDKILTDWNGLMIAACARYVQVFGDSAIYKRAAQSVLFIKTQLYTQEKNLLHRFRDGVAGLQANLDDYAFLVWGLIELYKTAFLVEYLQWALELHESMLEKFWDEDRGGFFFSPHDGESLIARPKEAYDGAIPSGNSIALQNLMRLARMTGRTDYEEKAHQLLRVFGLPVKRQPSGFTALLMGVSFALGPSYEIVVVGEKGAKDTEELMKVLREVYLPDSVVLFKEPGSNVLDVLAPFTSTMTAPNGRAAVYVCQNYQCHRPISDPAELKDLLT